MLNVFRIIGDGSHVLGLLILLAKYFSPSSTSGISARTQFLFTLTYILRYSDLFTTWISYYNTIMKMFIISSSALSMIVVLCILRKDYEKHLDTFWVELIAIPVTFLAFFVNHEYSVIEICWTWSMYMEAVALIPQFYMTWRGGRVDGYLITYVAALLIYRGSYIGNWIYRLYFETEYMLDPIAVVAGIVEVAVSLIGLIITLYRFTTYSAMGNSKQNPSIYTLPFVVHHANGSKFLNHHPSEKKSQKEPLGPYNPDLSVPILEYEETEYANNN